MTAQPSIVEFLNARLDEDEAFANVARLDQRTRSRRLRAVEAKRRIVELHSGGHECSGYDHNGDIDRCRYYHEWESCSTVLLLTLFYAEHKDYQESWKL